MTRPRWTTSAGCALLAAGSLVCVLPALRADDAKPPAGRTSARSTAEAGFAALRKAAADGDQAELAAALPAALVKDWPDDAAGEAKAWRAAFAQRVAAGTVAGVTEKGDTALARWKTTGPEAHWELDLRWDGTRWIAAAPWARCVAGGDVAKANGRGPAKVELRTRTTPDRYGGSAFSFVHVTQEPSQCKNRMDVIWCRCGQLHFQNAMASKLGATDLAKVEGWQRGGDWMDEIVPQAGAVYAVHLQRDGRRDFQVAMKVTRKGKSSLEFEWLLVAASKNAPADIRKPQPLVSGDGEDGTAGLCAAPGK